MINGNACFAYFNKIWGIPVHTGAACCTHGNDQFVCLMEGYGWQSLC